MEILQVKEIKKTYTMRFGGNQVQALKGVSFSVQEGEYVAIMGESGSGKTTLLNILAALDKPTGGQVMLEGKRLDAIEEDPETMRFWTSNGFFPSLMETRTDDNGNHVTELERQIIFRKQL